MYRKLAHVILSPMAKALCLAFVSIERPLMSADIISTEGAVLGAGYDSSTGQVLDLCIDQPQIETVGDGVKRVDYYLERIDSKEEFFKTLGLEAKARYGAAKGRIKIYNETNINKYSVHVAVRNSVLAADQRTLNVRLNEEAVKIASSNPERFRDICGDGYIFLINKGASLYGLLTINAASESEKQSVSAEVQGSTGIFTAQANYESAINKLKKQERISVRTTYIGTDASSPLPSSPEELILFSRTFATQGANKPTILGGKSLEYKTVLNYPDVDPFFVENKDKILGKIGEYQLSYEQDIDNISYVMDNPSEFVNPDLEELSRWRKTIAESLNILYDLGKRCYQDSTECKRPEGFLVAGVFTLPKRQLGIDPCIETEHKSCGAIYKLKATSKCQPLRFKRSSGSVCGVLKYKRKASSSCGSRQPKLGTGKVCGVISEQKEFWNVRNPLLSASSPDSRRKKIWNNDAADKFCLSKGFTKGYELGYQGGLRRNRDPWGPPRTPTYTTTNMSGGMTSTGNFVVINGVRYNLKSPREWRDRRWRFHSHFVCADKPLTCNNSAFGFEYPSCEHRDHGVDSYNTCEDQSFGVAQYKDCRHKDHGVESFKTCRVNPVTGQKCPAQ